MFQDRALNEIKRKKSRKKDTSKVKVIVFLILFLILVTAIFLFFGKISRVYLEGIENLSEEEILETINHDNLTVWKVLTGSMNYELKKIPRVKEVNYRWRFPLALNLQIDERNGAVVFIKEDNYWAIDKEAMVLGKADTSEKEFLKISGIKSKGPMKPGKDLSDTKYGTVLKDFGAKAENWAELPLEKISLKDLHNVKAYTEYGVEIKLGEEQEMSHKYEQLKRGLPYIPKKELNEPVDMSNHNIIVIPPS